MELHQSCGLELCKLVLEVGVDLFDFANNLGHGNFGFDLSTVFIGVDVDRVWLIIGPIDAVLFPNALVNFLCLQQLPD